MDLSDNMIYHLTHEFGQSAFFAGNEIFWEIQISWLLAHQSMFFNWKMVLKVGEKIIPIIGFFTKNAQ